MSCIESELPPVPFIQTALGRKGRPSTQKQARKRKDRGTVGDDTMPPSRALVWLTLSFLGMNIWIPRCSNWILRAGGPPPPPPLSLSTSSLWSRQPTTIRFFFSVCSSELRKRPAIMPESVGGSGWWWWPPLRLCSVCCMLDYILLLRDTSLRRHSLQDLSEYGREGYRPQT